MNIQTITATFFDLAPFYLPSPSQSLAKFIPGGSNVQKGGPESHPNHEEELLRLLQHIMDNDYEDLHTVNSSKTLFRTPSVSGKCQQDVDIIYAIFVVMNFLGRNVLQQSSSTFNYNKFWPLECKYKKNSYNIRDIIKII